MSFPRSRAAAVALVSALLASTPFPAHAEIQWPRSELSAHVQAYFAQLRGDEASARRFFATHWSPASLAETSVETKLQRRTAALERTQGLTPLEVVNEDSTSMEVRCRAGNGDLVTAIFEAEEAPPHWLLVVRLEANAPDGPGPGAHPPGGLGGETARNRGERERPSSAGPGLSDAELADRVRAHLNQKHEAGEFSGVALLVRGDSTLLSDAWGEADREKHVPITPETRFNLGSIGKLFTRTAIAQLAEKGKLSLDDKLSKYLPDFPHANEITLDMLCQHRSGVGDLFNDKYHAMDHSRLRHNRDYLELIRDQPLWFKPGTSERYSNGGYALLGEVIAKASGEDYYDYLAEHIFGPAGMLATGAPIEGDGTRGLARGYTREDAPDGKERDNVAMRPARGSAAGGSYSTAADMLTFDRALFAGKLCDPAWSAWVTGDSRPDHGGGGSLAGSPAFGFGGGAPGITSEWLHEGDTVLIVLTNRDPEVTQPVMRPLRDLVRQVRPQRKRGRG